MGVLGYSQFYLLDSLNEERIDFSYLISDPVLGAVNVPLDVIPGQTIEASFECAIQPGFCGKSFVLTDERGLVMAISGGGIDREIDWLSVESGPVEVRFKSSCGTFQERKIRLKVKGDSYQMLSQGERYKFRYEGEQYLFMAFGVTKAEKVNCSDVGYFESWAIWRL